MGNRQAVLSPEKLEQYQDCTYFSKTEIVRLYQRFRELGPDIVPSFMPNDCVESVLVPAQLVGMMSELKDNPFVEQIISVFSDNGTGYMNFENFLDMFNVMNDQASVDLKTIYAFKIFDNDKDKSLNSTDLKWALQKLTKNELNRNEIELVVEKVIEESEMDDDWEISFMEFEHVVARSPDFKNTFRLRI
ncbi:calcium and integrin-binding family member 2-like [Styela clava]